MILAKKFRLEAYEVNFELVVCDSIQKAHNVKARRKRLSGTYDDDECVGLCCVYHRDVCVFYVRSGLTHAIIAHELRHATDSVLKINGIPFSEDLNTAEVPALICDYLTRLVYSQLKKWKIRIK